MTEENLRNGMYPPDRTTSRSPWKRLWTGILTAVLCLILAAAAVFFVTRSVSGQNENPVPAETSQTAIR